MSHENWVAQLERIEHRKISDAAFSVIEPYLLNELDFGAIHDVADEIAKAVLAALAVE